MPATNGTTAVAQKTAVFYDVDGTLLKSNIVYIYLYYAMRHAKLSSRAREFLKLLTMTPAYKVIDLFSREYFNKVFYRNYKGLGYDRLRQLGDEIARETLIPNVYPGAMQRIEQAREMGLVQVLVTGSVEYVIRPFADALGIEHIITNKLEIDEFAVATGRLVEPILAGNGKREVMEEFARKHDIDLAHSYAFADSKGDLEMLETVGYPVCINPERRLEKIAHKRQWTIQRFS